MSVKSVQTKGLTVTYRGGRGQGRAWVDKLSVAVGWWVLLGGGRARGKEKHPASRVQLTVGITDVKAGWVPVPMMEI